MRVWLDDGGLHSLVILDPRWGVLRVDFDVANWEEEAIPNPTLLADFHRWAWELRWFHQTGKLAFSLFPLLLQLKGITNGDWSKKSMVYEPKSWQPSPNICHSTNEKKKQAVVGWTSHVGEDGSFDTIKLYMFNATNPDVLRVITR